MTEEQTIANVSTGEIATLRPGHMEMAPPVKNSIFSSLQAFEEAQRMVKPLAASDMVPKQYRNNPANCVIALELSQRIGASVFAVMQNLAVVHGKPTWEAKFIIAALNSCNRFSPLRFKITQGEKKEVAYTYTEWQGQNKQRKQGKEIITDMVCVAAAYDKNTGELLEGPPVSMEMAVQEGWYSKDGSKWKTMPELMIRYRAASFFGKLYAPDILVGMQTAEEVGDIIDVTPEPERTVATEAPKQTRAETVKSKLKDQQEPAAYFSTDAAIKDLQSAPDTAALDLLFEQHVHAVDPKDKPKLQKAYQGKRTELDQS